MMRKAGNTWQRKDSNRSTTAETTYRNSLPTQVNAYNFTYHAKQWGKGLLVFGAGLLGYVGFSAFFGSRRVVNTPETERMLDLVSPDENLLNMQHKISGIPTSFEHHAPKEFLSTSFSASRTLLSIKEAENKNNNKDDIKLNDRSTKTNKKSQLTVSQQRRSITDKYYVGVEFRVNTYRTSNQENPAVAGLTGEGFVVVWQDGTLFGEGQDGDGKGVYGQRYNSAGQPENLEFQVNTYTNGDQDSPAVIGLTDAGYVVVWSGSGQDGAGIYGQRFDASGQPDGSEFRVNTYTSGSQKNPAMSAFTDGSFVVVWTSYGQDGDSYGIYGQRYNAANQVMGLEFQVNTYITSYQENPAVTSLTDGGFVVVWQSYEQDGSYWGIYGQRYDAAGLSIGSEFQVNTYTTYSQENPAVAPLTDGGFVVVWAGEGATDSSGVYGQRYDTIGRPQGPEFQINTYTSSVQGNPSVAHLTKGGSMVVWASSGQDGSGYGIYGQLYNSTAHSVYTEFQVNTYTTWDQSNPVVASLDQGGFVVVWESQYQDGSGNGVYGQTYFLILLKILSNSLVISEGQTVLMTLNQLSAGKPSDIENINIIFSINNLQHGRFERVDQPSVAITTFTQQDIIDGKIQFTHDGSSTAPAYQVKVNDQLYQPAVISFIPINDAPQIINNRLEISTGESIVLTSTQLSAMDEDNNNATLIFIAKNVKNGRFEKRNDLGKDILEFTQQQIFDKRIQFTHDAASTLAPFYTVKVSDGQFESSYSLANITYHNVPTTPVVMIMIGGLLGTTTLCIGAASCILFTVGALVVKNNKKKYARLKDSVELAHLSAPFLKLYTLSPFMQTYNIKRSEIELIEFIDAGGQGSVYKATWKNQEVAYKLTSITQEEAVKEFEKEAKIMLKSNHPNIVRVYRICAIPGKIGLVMEFMALGSLKKAIKEKTLELSWTSKWNIAHDLASVTQFLHEQSIVHRDIKTDNLLLYRGDDGLHVKITDFGLSKMQQNLDLSVTMGIGTTKYMAPETVLSDDGKFSEKAGDVYAIGMTFVVLITEAEPYPDVPNDLSIPYRVGNLKLYQKIDKTQCPYAFFKLTNQCRSIQPDNRPMTEEIVEELENMKEEVMNFTL